MYEQTYKRLEKLKTTFDHLVINNQKLQEELKSLRQYVATSQAREEARERVLIKISEKIKEDGEGIPPPT